MCATQELPGEQNGRDKVCVDDLFDLVGACVHQQGVLTSCRVVDQAVHRTEALGRLVKETLHRALVNGVDGGTEQNVRVPVGESGKLRRNRPGKCRHLDPLRYEVFDDRQTQPA